MRGFKLAAAAVLLAGLAAATAGDNTMAGPLDRKMKGIDGKDVDLSQFKGKVVLVNIWATWCPPCVAEMPMLDHLQKMMPFDKFTVVAISMDTTSMKMVTDFLKKQHIQNLTPYWDKDRQIPLKWKYEGLPTSFLLDRNGNLIKQYDGPYEWDRGDMLKEIKAQVLK